MFTRIVPIFTHSRMQFMSIDNRNLENAMYEYDTPKKSTSNGIKSKIKNKKVVLQQHDFEDNDEHGYEIIGLKHQDSFPVTFVSEVLDTNIQVNEQIKNTSTKLVDENLIVVHNDWEDFILI